jgi:hypothetical protein
VTTIRRVSAWELRAAFNATGLYERAEKGDPSLMVFVDDGVPDSRYHQPPGTTSRTWSYWEIQNGALVKLAVAHGFVLSDGRINNPAGRPDPKYLRLGDEILLLPRPTKPTSTPTVPPPSR